MQKSIQFSILVFLSTILLFSCKKEDKKDDTKITAYQCSTCIKSPEAKPANDTNSKGIYKGVIIGSTGTIKFSIANVTNEITATLVIDGKTVMLTSALTWVSGKPYVAPFTGTLDGSPISITFSVQFDGSTPQIISSDIPGHPNAVFDIVKETSSALIECFEGTYSTTLPEKGTFNVVLSRQIGKFKVVSREDGSTSYSNSDGSIATDGTIKNDDGATIGKLIGDNMNGSFTNSSGNKVTFDGKRTL